MRIKIVSCLICCMLFSFFLIVGSQTLVSASTIIVPDHYPTIQDALDAANKGDIIYVRAGNYYENIYINKTITLQGENKTITIINGGGKGDVVNISTDLVNISGFNIINSGSSTDDAGLKINSNYNTISQNIISNNQYGIRLKSLSGNNIINNNVFLRNQLALSLISSEDNLIKHNFVSNNQYGISLYFYSNNNTVIENNVSNSHTGISISLYSSNNVIIYNNASNNDGDGIAMVYRCNNNIIANNIVSNNLNGIALWDRSNDNTIFNNTIYNNGWGVHTGYSPKGNLFYHNNIINNYVSDPSRVWNDWHHPDLLEGNYWSWYTGLDDGSGSGKHAIAGDGIGDTLIPYPKSYYDYYPFTNKNGWIKTSTEATIDIDPDTINLKSKGNWITCYITLNEPYDPSSIDISTILLEDTIPAEWGNIQGDRLMVKFDRSDVQALLPVGTYNLKVTGELADATSFEGYSDEIRVIDPGK